MSQPDDTYYFGGPVPRDIQEKLEACRDRGMRNQTIARKLAYLWLALPEERQNELYFGLIDSDFDPEDKRIADLFRAVDDIVVGQILACLPESARLIEAFASAEERRPDRHRSASHRQLKKRPPAG